MSRRIKDLPTSDDITKLRRSSSSKFQWPDSVPMHPRILSSWADNVLRLDGTPATGLKEIDLAAVPLPANRHLGGPFDDGLTLGQFPDWLDVARAHVVMTLQDTQGHSPVGLVVNGLNHLFRFFAWCVLRRVYRLSALTPLDMAALVDAMRPGGWFSALGTAERLDCVVERAQLNSEFRVSLVRTVLPGLAWVEIKAAAEEIRSGLEVFRVAVATSATLDGHELAVDAFGHRVGDA